MIVPFCCATFSFDPVIVTWRAPDAFIARQYIYNGRAAGTFGTRGKPIANIEGDRSRQRHRIPPTRISEEAPQ